MQPRHTVNVGITEWHGVAHELAQFPPEGISYVRISASQTTRFRYIRSQIKGYLRDFSGDDCDLIEAILSPIRTRGRWIYSVANFQEATTFNLLGVPLPRPMRVAYLERLFIARNFKKLIFWSHAGRQSLESYGHLRNPTVLAKTTVVYPAIRRVSDNMIRSHADGTVNILFSGDFFRKGGVHVVDAFERALAVHQNISLRLCCDPEADFNSANASLRSSYLDRIRRNPRIAIGRVDRTDMIEKILPITDIYALPTYVEAFGYAILEAMAYGIPVISTNYFAIPEILRNEETGLLIDTRSYDCETLFRGYRVDVLPSAFQEFMTEEFYRRLMRLLESPTLRGRLGGEALLCARTKFSFNKRNELMSSIYREALTDY